MAAGSPQAIVRIERSGTFGLLRGFEVVVDEAIAGVATRGHAMRRRTGVTRRPPCLCASAPTKQREEQHRRCGSRTRSNGHLELLGRSFPIHKGLGRSLTMGLGHGNLRSCFSLPGIGFSRPQPPHHIRRTGTSLWRLLRIGWPRAIPSARSFRDSVCVYAPDTRPGLDLVEPQRSGPGAVLLGERRVAPVAIGLFRFSHRDDCPSPGVTGAVLDSHQPSGGFATR